MRKTIAAYKHSPTLGDSWAYMGNVLTIPVGGGNTGGRLAVVEVKGRPGNEPPPHIHEWEDEIFHVVEGAVAFHCGRDRFVAGAGDHVFIPRGAPHAFAILTPAVRMIVTARSVDERPVGLDRYFLAMSEPATSLDLPAAGTAMTYATSADLAHATRLAAEHGIRFLNPDEARELLPGYPGFGAPER